MRRIAPLLVLVAALAAAFAAQAQTVYVSDELQVAVRSGPSHQHRILHFVASGTRLEALENEEDWRLVRDGRGREGWVESAHLMEQPSARERLEALSTNLEGTRSENAALELALDEREARVKELEQTVAGLEARNGELEAELERAADGLELADENERMEEVMTDLQHRVGRLEGERAALLERQQRDLFLAGVGVLVGGVLLGLILPHLRLRRRKRWDDPF